MANTKLTGLTATTAPLTTDIIYVVVDPGGTPASRKVTFANVDKALNAGAGIETTSTPRFAGLGIGVAGASNKVIGGSTLTLEPAAGSNLIVTTSGVGDLVVNTTQLVVDTSAARVGVGTATPNKTFEVVGSGNVMRLDSSSANNRIETRSTATSATGNDAGLEISVKDSGANQDLVATFLGGLSTTTAGAEQTRITMGGFISGTSVTMLRCVNGLWALGSNPADAVERLTVNGSIAFTDGVSVPVTSAGFAKIYVDSADGDLKVIFGDGIVKTLATDT